MTRFNPRERKFLELYFSGCKIKTAAIGAGYGGRSPQALCNRGRRILNKLSNNPNAFSRLVGLRGLRIARLIADTMEGDSKPRQLEALKILARAFFP